MIKKSIFEEELIERMHKQLIKQATQLEFDNLEKAADYLNSAAEIFEDMGMKKNADQVLNVLFKIAQKSTQQNDSHIKGLTSEKMVDNLKNHGTVFNLSDDQLMNCDISDVLEVSDGEIEIDNFEDERDNNFAKTKHKSHPHDPAIKKLDEELDKLFKLEGHSAKYEKLLQEQEKLIAEVLKSRNT